MKVWQRRRPSTAKGLAAGLVGGLAASWVMNRFQDGLAWVSRNRTDAQEHQQGGQGNPGAQPQASSQGESSEPATKVVATAIAEKVFHHELRPSEQAPAETAVHYGYGTLVGCAYGMACEHWPVMRAGEGSVFGAALWLGSDEIMLSATGIAKPPHAYPFKVHASALAAHIVYGLSLELCRRALRKVW